MGFESSLLPAVGNEGLKGDPGFRKEKPTDREEKSNKPQCFRISFNRGEKNGPKAYFGNSSIRRERDRATGDTGILLDRGEIDLRIYFSLRVEFPQCMDLGISLSLGLNLLVQNRPRDLFQPGSGKAGRNRPQNLFLACGGQ